MLLQFLMAHMFNDAVLCYIIGAYVRKHSSLGRPQRINRVALYGINLIPMEKL